MDLQKIGSYTGILGAILVALNMSVSKYGFILFLVSSIALTIFAHREQLKPLMQMQLVFMVINTVGIIRWF